MSNTRAAYYQSMWTITRQRLETVETRLAEIAKIIELGDHRLMAADGPCGNLPPDISLAEWRQMYCLAKGLPPDNETAAQTVEDLEILGEM